MLVLKIRPIDPYGRIQWYFRYWKGRRSEDDQRQMVDGKEFLVDLKVF